MAAWPTTHQGEAGPAGPWPHYPHYYYRGPPEYWPQHHQGPAPYGDYRPWPSEEYRGHPGQFRGGPPPDDYRAPGPAYSDYRAPRPAYSDPRASAPGYGQPVEPGNGPFQGHPAYPVHYSEGRRAGSGLEKETSTDEGENTSNDAGDISSSGESGGGRRRRTGGRGRSKQRSPAPQDIQGKPRDPPPKEEYGKPGYPTSQQGYSKPRDADHQGGFSKPKLPPEDVAANMQDISTGPTVNHQDTKNPTIASLDPKIAPPLSSAPSPAKVKTPQAKSTNQVDLSYPKPMEKEVKPAPTPTKPQTVQTKLSDEKLDVTQNKSGQEAVSLTTGPMVTLPQNHLLQEVQPSEANKEEPKPGVSQLTSETSDTTEPLAPAAQEVVRRASMDRERKVGLTTAPPPAQPATGDAYQALVAGVANPRHQVLLEEEDTTSDDVEDEFAVLAKPRQGAFRSAGAGLHDEDEDFFDKKPSKPSPAPRGLSSNFGGGGVVSGGGGMGHMAGLAMAVGGGRGGLAGGRLGHPAAQAMAMQAAVGMPRGLKTRDSDTEDGGANMSAPEHDEEEEDFWS